jgi:signal transduction histidine kinase
MKIRERIIRGLLVFLAVIPPVLAGYVTYDQMRTPVFDAKMERESGTVLAMEQDSFANWAGFHVGDVILSVNGAPYPQWPPVVGNYPAQVRRGAQVITLEIPLVAMAKVNLPSLLNAVVVAMTFWGVGVFLLWRRFRQYVARLFFLMTQSIGIGLLFFLAYPQVSSRPGWMVVLISAGFHLSASFVVHYYLTFPVRLGSPRQRRWIMTTVYGLMLVALACRLSSTELGLRISFFYNTAEISAAVGLLIYAYQRRATPDDRRRLRIIVIGSIASMTPSFMLYLLPTIMGSSYRMPDWMVGPFIIITPLCYLAAIARHNLFGIDRLLNRALVYAALSLGILLLYLGPFLLIVRFASGDWLAQMMAAAGLTLAVGLAFERTKNALQRLVDRLFYGGWYDYPAVVEQVSRALAGCIERGPLREALTRQVPDLMQLQGGDLRFDEGAWPVVASPPGARFSLAFQGQPRALWSIGPHRDGDDLTDSDRRILDTLARQAEIALGNVLLIERLRAQLNEIRASREALSQAQRRLLRSREEERARLARDLHDGPLQALIGLNLQLGLLLPQAGEPAALGEMRVEVRGLLSDLRGVCSELRPPMLDTLGLAAALRSLAEDWSAQSGVAVNLDLPPHDDALPPMPGDMAVNLYRVAQEALANVAKHAQANRVEIRLARDGNGMGMDIEDDGRGFAMPDDIGDLISQGHFGLAGLRERVNLIGGTLSLRSAPGQGTRIHVQWRPPSQ